MLSIIYFSAGCHLLLNLKIQPLYQAYNQCTFIWNLLTLEALTELYEHCLKEVLNASKTVFELKFFTTKDSVHTANICYCFESF